MPQLIAGVTALGSTLLGGTILNGIVSIPLSLGFNTMVGFGDERP